MSKEAMKLALEHAKRDERHASHAETRYWCRMYRDIAEKAVEALAEQPAQQEPVAWGIIASNTGRICQVELDADEIEGHNPKYIVPLYTSPPASKPLTDEEIESLYEKTESVNWARSFARAIEAKLKQKNQ